MSVTQENLLQQLSQFRVQASQIKLRHNTEADLKLLNDPIQDYTIELTPSLLKYGNVNSIVDLYLKKMVDENHHDLGIKSKLLNQKRPTVAQSSRLTQPSATAKSSLLSKKPDMRSTVKKSPTRDKSNKAPSSHAVANRMTKHTRTQTATSSRPKSYGASAKQNTAGQDISVDRLSSNPVLKPGVTAEDLAARLLSHKLTTENKLKLERERQEEQIRANQRLQLTNTYKNDKLLSGTRAPLKDRVDKILE